MNSDIGNPENPCYTIYDPAEQIYTLKRSGYNIWFEKDEFHYMYNKIKGDLILIANFKFKGNGTEFRRKAGWMPVPFFRADSLIHPHAPSSPGKCEGENSFYM